jgi:hypothetical protein
MPSHCLPEKKGLKNPAQVTEGNREKLPRFVLYPRKDGFLMRNV